ELEDSIAPHSSPLTRHSNREHCTGAPVQRHSLFNLNADKPSATAANTTSATSCSQNASSPAPLRTIARSATRKYRAGTIRLTAWTAAGMLEMGKTKPERMKVGRKDDRSATWKATCCEVAIVEMSSPCACAPTRNSAIDPHS